MDNFSNFYAYKIVNEGNLDSPDYSFSISLDNSFLVGEVEGFFYTKNKLENLLGEKIAMISLRNRLDFEEKYEGVFLRLKKTLD